MTMNSLPIFAIEVPADRARDLDPAWAEALAAVIAAQGLHHPIRVRQVGAAGEDDGWRLVSGLHRLEAARLLGWTEIAVTVSTVASDDEARLEEVMENLGRHELIALDRCHHLHELKQVWERLYPEAKHGGKRAGAGRKESQTDANGSQRIKAQSLRLDYSGSEVFGFVRATAERIGLSQRSIEQAVRIWRGLSRASRARLPGTALARKQTELAALAELKPAVQEQVLDLIFGDAEPGNIAQALEYLENGRALNAVEKRFQTASRAFGALDDDTMEGVISCHRDRVMAALKRLGWI